MFVTEVSKVLMLYAGYLPTVTSVAYGRLAVYQYSTVYKMPVVSIDCY